jgi:hypothetical protein
LVLVRRREFPARSTRPGLVPAAGLAR